VLGPATLAPTAVESSPGTRNVIPDRVVVALDWRILPGDDRDVLLRRLREAVAARVGEQPPGGRGVEVRMATERQRSWTGVEEERDLLTPGFLMDAEDGLVRAAADAVGRRDGEGPASVRPWTFATDGGWTRGVFGIPTIGFAPGEERFAHTNRERLDVEEARWAFSRHVPLVLALQEAASA
jgi:acetylornithine deacetylase/succinyl-diaminopimelate desuccinylase-like protein